MEIGVTDNRKYPDGGCRRTSDPVTDAYHVSIFEKPAYEHCPAVHVFVVGNSCRWGETPVFIRTLLRAPLFFVFLGY